MVLLIERFEKVFSKLENLHHRHESDAFSASLEVFQTDVLNFLNRLVSNSESRAEIFTFPWIQQWIEAIAVIHRSFAKLVVNIDYPVCKWESDSINRFFGYTLTLMEVFNLMSSSLSHLAQARISLSYALILEDNSTSSAIMERLRPIKSTDFHFNFKEIEAKLDGQEGRISDKESVILQALAFMRGYGLLLCGIVLSGLHGDSKPYFQMRNLAGEFSVSSFKDLDSSFLSLISKMGPVLKEVKEINYAIPSVVDAIVDGKRKDEETEEMQRKLQVFEKGIDDFRKEVDSLFSEILEERDGLLESLRDQNK